ncbi:MAG: hypothetical protein GXZ08_10060 [Tissierellia bacterium]|nr:hypothetical protein [Tissierellia bacterium]
MNAITALTFVLVVMTIGDLVSAKTKAFVPSVFVSAILFLVGFWYIFPEDLVKIATLSQPVAGLTMYLLITHMGTMMSVRELAAQWKTIVIALAGIAGIIILLLTVGSAVLGRETAVVGAPPLTGGIVAAILMRDAAAEIGKQDLAVLSILVYVVQGFIGYPLTAILLKRNGQKLLADFRKNPSLALKRTEEDKVVEGNGKKGIKFPPDIPEKYNSTYMILFRLAFVALLADIAAKYLNMGLLAISPKAPTISVYVVCLIFGVIAAEIGLVERKPLNKAESFGWLMTCLMAFIFEGLNAATPEMLLQVLMPLVGVILIGVTGLIIFAFIAGKVLGENPEMSISIALNALYGFPPNFILTTEAINSLTENQVEKEYLTDNMLPKMLVGGFTSVTIASVIIAGIFVGFL